jgi:allene oxide cyclase-like protein
MRRIALIGSASALLLGLVGVLSSSVASQAAEPAAAKATTLTFDVVFSPFTVIAANNVRDPNSPFSVGDEIVFRDQLLSHGKQVGDDAGSCVIVTITPDVVANCTGVFRVPGGTIAAQFVSMPGPAPKDLALTGGTGAYRNSGGEATLVEFGNGKGSLTMRVLSFVARGGGHR